MKLIPRWYQEESAQAFWDSLRKNRSASPLIELPTGSGKSLVIAMLIEKCLKWNRRVMVLAHRKELLQQNADKIMNLTGLGKDDVGVYSAGLKSRDTEQDIICAGIQSVAKKPEEFGHRDLILIDEAHLVSGWETSMYGRFLEGMQNICPGLVLGGLTATPYRLDSGHLVQQGSAFSEICYAVKTGVLIGEGFLSPVTNKPSETEVDVSDVKLVKGEFKAGDIELVFDATVEAAVTELICRTRDRLSTIIFACGVMHGEHITATLRARGIEAEIITGNSMPIERAGILARFKAGDLPYLVNCDVLTTGFDAPCIDCVAVMRATMSPGLFAQMVGRGLRLSPETGKKDCLVLDFGGNIGRHGALDDAEYGVQSVKSTSESSGDADSPSKECPGCKNEVPVQTRRCDNCGFLFPWEARHEESADTDSDLVSAEPEEVFVYEVAWNLHNKRGAEEGDPRTLKVTYVIGETEKPENGIGGNLFTTSNRYVSEWVCFEHSGFARDKAEKWWGERSDCDVPRDIDEAVMFLDAGVARAPHRLKIIKEGKWDRILHAWFTDDKPTVDDVDVVDDFVPASERDNFFIEVLDEELPF